MLKKLLAIAMIGTAMTASAEVPMGFTSVLNNIDGGGHFYIDSYDEATGVTTFKSIHSGSTEAEIKAALGLKDEEKVADAILANPAGGARYIGTTSVEEGKTWQDMGLDANHKFLTFDYKVTKAHQGIQIWWHLINNETSNVNADLTVSDEWQTVIAQVKTGAQWADTPGQRYMWFVFNGWTNTPEEITFQVRNLAFKTPEEVGIEPEPALPGTEPGVCEVPVNFAFNVLGGFTKETNTMGDPYFLTGGAAANPLLASQNFIGTIPASASILEFDYKTSEAFKFVLYAMQSAASNPNPRIAGGLTPIAIVDLEEYYDYGMIEDPEATWNHVRVDMLNDKMPGVYAGDFAKAKFAQKENSNDCLWIQAQGFKPDTEFYLKDLRFVNDPAGIQGVGVEEDSEVVSSQYFDLQGRQLKAAPESGLYLRRDLRANGTSTTVKAVK